MIPPRLSASQTSNLDPSLQRLAGAVLIQALDDLTRGPRRSREEALDWIMGKTADGFSFELCCNLLGRNSEDVLHRVQRFFFMPNGSSAAFSSSSQPFSQFLS